VKDHQKEGTEKVEHFCEEIPAVLTKNQLYEILPTMSKNRLFMNVRDTYYTTNKNYTREKITKLFELGSLA